MSSNFWNDQFSWIEKYDMKNFHRMNVIKYLKK